MVDTVKVCPVHPGVVESLCRNLRELAGTDPSGRHEGVHGRDVALPIRASRVMSFPRFTVIIQADVIAVPLVRLHGESVRRIRGAFMMAMDLNRRELC